ncbi:MAG: GPR endopeptidase [Clostridia bacterium]|nr:GPR endopeptidase [Clostridia bacterium]
MKNSQFSYQNYKADSPSLRLRTDLACESPSANGSSPGTDYKEYSVCGIPVCELRVLSHEGEMTSGRAMGRYLTLLCPTIRYLSEEKASQIIHALSATIASFTESVTKKAVSPSTKVLVAGLGNRFISSDAIGPRTADKIAVTGHMMNSDSREIFKSIGCAQLCAIHPGVMGQTGIEAAAMIKGAAEYVRPDVILAIDALAARSTRRLCSTFQLSDTGIEPGSGIGNRRGAVNRSTVGFPVIAIGVPTVVDCATLVCDALEKHGIHDFSSDAEIPFTEERSLFVSLGDSDIVTEEISSLLAGAINRAFFCEGL